MNSPKIDASQLTGVSETAPLTLNGRAHQASLPGAILHDPMAIELRDAITATRRPRSSRWPKARFSACPEASRTRG